MSNARRGKDRELTNKMRPTPSGAPRINLWTPPKMWKDQTSIIIGGGPSILKTNLEPIHDYRVIGTNQAYELGSWVDICFFGDQRWFWWNRDDLRINYMGLIVSCCPEMAAKEKNPGWIKVTARGKHRGIEERPGKLAWNGNTGACAINLAYHLGSTKIILVGFDMYKEKNASNGGNNYHDKHKVTPKNPYPTYLKKFSFIAADAKRLGITIINATPGSVIKEFPIMTLEEALIKIDG